MDVLDQVFQDAFGISLKAAWQQMSDTAYPLYEQIKSLRTEDANTIDSTAVIIDDTVMLLPSGEGK
jgi:hypothetical protein